MGWLRFYVRLIVDEWCCKPQSWVGWFNRVLILFNLRIVALWTPSVPQPRRTVIRVNRWYDHSIDDPIGAGMTWLT